MLNNTEMSVLITPEEFLNIYHIIYNFDENIARFKELSLILSVVFMIVGILNNTTCIYVVWQGKLLEKKFNWYFLIKSVFRLIFCVTLFSDYIFSKMYYRKIFLHDLNKYAELIIDFIIHTSDSCVSLLTFFLTLDRLYAIKYPLKIKDFFTTLHPKYLISISLVVFIIFVLLNFVLCEHKLGSQFQNSYCSIVSPTILNSLPLLAILVLNILLIIEKVKKYFHHKTSLRYSLKSLIELQNFKEENSSVRLYSHFFIETKQENYKIDKSHYFVIIVNIWSFITSTPYYILNSYHSLYHLNLFSIETLVKIQIISSLLFNSNYCIHFFLYFSFYVEFREFLIGPIKRQLIRKKSTSIRYI